MISKAALLSIFTSIALYAQSAASPMPFVKPQFFTNNGLPAAGYRLCTFAAGTTNPQLTYTTSAATVPNTNPVVLDAAGRADIFLSSGKAYKIGLLMPTSTSADCQTGSMSYIWTEDNIVDNAGLLKAALATSAGAALIGFSQSSPYPSGTVGAKLQQTISVTDPPFNANCNGTADTTAAFSAALASLGATGGQILIPANSTCNTVTGIVVSLNGQFIRIVGQGASSVIQCTGVPCLQFTGPNAQGQSGASNLAISDPVGNSSTIALYLNGENAIGGLMTNLEFSNLKITGNGNLQSGGHFAGLGIGVENSNATLNYFNHVDVAYFHTAVLETGSTPSFFSSSVWTRSHIYGSGANGWDIESSGDHFASQNDFEGNTGAGVYMGAVSNVAQITQSHFESNNANQFELAGTGSQLVSSANNYEGGTAKVDASAIFISNPGDNFGAMELTVNSTGGAGLPGASITNPLFSPTISGTGCTIYTIKGTNLAFGAGCSGAPYSISGFSSYSFDAPTVASVPVGSASNPSILAVDLDTSATAACYGFVSHVSAYTSGNPSICWDTGTGGFDFFPVHAIGGGNDYSFRNAAGSSIGSVSDAGVWTLPKLNLSQLPTSCSAQPAGTVWNNSGALGICP